MEQFSIKIEEESEFSEAHERHMNFDDACRSAACSALNIMRDRAAEGASLSASCSITDLATGVVRQLLVKINVHEGPLAG